MKDYIAGANKIKSIMRPRETIFVCRTCQMSHDKFKKANDCCSRKVIPFNKRGEHA